MRPFPQDPTACSAREPSRERRSSRRGGRLRVLPGVLADVSWYTDRITSAPLVSIHLRGFRGMVPPGQHRVALDVSAGRRARQVLLRKEVIQPHLPVRLPCYDFVPIAGPTFDGSLPYGLGHRLRVLLTFVT